MSGCESLFGAPLLSAQKIMDQIKNELGLWCSIGISYNKFLSKMASEIKKPLGITELWQQDLKTKLWPLPIGAMYGVGKQTAQKLISLGIETIGDLAALNKDYLVKMLGKMGGEIHRRANGIDDSPVIPHSHDEIKSIGRSVTLAKDITDIEEAKTVIMKLADEIGMEARRYSKKGRSIQITIKYSDFKSITRQKTVSFTYLTKEICTAGIELLAAHWISTRPVRLLGISLSGFDEDFGMEQISLFESADEIKSNVKEEKLEKVLDEIRNKHGRATINRAVLLENED
jgi:DNA polymerase-4